MAEAAKLQPIPSTSNNPRVIALTVGDGGLALLGLGTRTYLEVPSEEKRASNAPGTLTTLHMELDRALGGVVVRWQARDVNGKQVNKRVLVPMSHCRVVELEA